MTPLVLLGIMALALKFPIAPEGDSDIIANIGVCAVCTAFVWDFLFFFFLA